MTDAQFRDRYWQAYQRLTNAGQYMEAIQAIAHYFRLGGEWN